jgi:alkaline phosphatase
VITADHDHTLILNGYAKRTGKYVQGQETSVLGLVKNYDRAGFAKIFMDNLIRLLVLVRAKNVRHKIGWMT